MSPEQEIEFTLNGRPTQVSVPIAMSALDMLRGPLGLTGTKLGCGEGECGACTIVVDGRSYNSCLLFAVECAGRDVLTIEGVREAGGLDRLQREFVRHGAVQCGFCTPGMVMQARALLARQPDADEVRIRRGLEGNLCRCTGYRKIIDAVAAAARGGGDA